MSLAPGEIRDRILRFDRVPAASLRANPRNWRKHPKAQRAALAAVLERIGFAGAALVRETDDGLELIDGHLRADMAEGSDVPVLVVDVTEEEAAYLLATLDPIAGMATTDAEALEALVGGLELEAPVSDMLGGLLGTDRRRGLTDPDAVPNKPPVPVSQPGDVWICGDHLVACGDATDPAVVASVLEGLEVRLLLTDPPYGVDYVGGTPDALTIQGDKPKGLQALIGTALGLVREYMPRGAAFYVCAPSGPQNLDFRLALIDAGLELRQGLVWVKHKLVLGHSDYHMRSEDVLVGADEVLDPAEDPAWMHESILYGWAPGSHYFAGGRKLDSVWEIRRPDASREHPTMKPVELCARAVVASSRFGDVVVDPFLGSGSTMIAAQQLGRRCIGIELDPVYADVAVKRWEEFSGQTAVRRG